MLGRSRFCYKQHCTVQPLAKYDTTVELGNLYTSSPLTLCTGEVRMLHVEPGKHDSGVTIQ